MQLHPVRQGQKKNEAVQGWVTEVNDIIKCLTYSVNASIIINLIPR